MTLGPGGMGAGGGGVVVPGGKSAQGELHRRRAILGLSMMPARLNSGQRVD